MLRVLLNSFLSAQILACVYSSLLFRDY